jgi:hypothetical protein
MGLSIGSLYDSFGGKMKSITIHGVDGPLAEMIKSKAQSEGLSVNQTIKKILESALGVKPRRDDIKRGDFEEFCGIWKEADLAEFKVHTKALSKVDPGDWR